MYIYIINKIKFEYTYLAIYKFSKIDILNYSLERLTYCNLGNKY